MTFISIITLTSPERHGIQQHDCLSKSLLRLTLKKTSKFLYDGNSMFNGGFPTQRDSSTESISTISWHHDGYRLYFTFQDDIVGTLLKRVGHITVEQNARNIRWATFNKATKWIHLELLEVRKVIYICDRGYCFHPTCFFLLVCVFVFHNISPDDLTMKDWCNPIFCRNIKVRMSRCASHVLHIHDVIDDVTRSKSM